MSEQLKPKISAYLIFGIVLATLANITISIMTTHKELNLHQQNLLAIWGITLPVLVACFSLLAWQQARSHWRLVLGSLLLGLLSISPFIWDKHIAFVNFILIITSIYAMHSFHMAYQTDRSIRCYTTLFYAAWDSVIKIIVAIIFSLLLQIIWQLVALCFSLLGLDFLANLFRSSFALAITLSFTFVMGLYLADITPKIIRNLRFLFLQICRWLLPVLSFLGIIVIAAIYIQALIAHKLPSFSHYTALGYLLLSILFINGVYQRGDASENSAYAKLIVWCVNVYITMMPLLAISSLLNTFQVHAFNSDNLGLYLLGVLLLIYAVSYAILVNLPAPAWLSHLKGTNIILALLVIMTTLVSNAYPLPQFGKADVVKHKLDSNDFRVNLRTQTDNLKNRRKQAKLEWSSAKKQVIALGQNAQAASALCQIKLYYDDLPGVLIGHRCRVAMSDNTVIFAPQYKVLVGDMNKLRWQTKLDFVVNKPLPQQRVPLLLAENNGIPYFACRVQQHGKLFVGTYFYTDHSCRFVVGDKALESKQIQDYLYIY